MSITEQTYRPELSEQLQPRLATEAYFNRTGGTFRKGRFRLWFNRVVKAGMMIMAFKLLGIYRRGRRNALDVRVNRLEIAFPALPSNLDGFEILQVSDLHVDKLPGLTEVLERILPQLKPDLCVLTGDYRYEVLGSCTGVYPRLSRIVSCISSRHGTVGILGNHDAAEIAFFLEQHGVRMLINEWVRVTDNLNVAGTDDSFDYRCADLDRALAGTPKSEFVVLLAHSPELAAEAAIRSVDLYLTGHTHAGQIRLPLIGAVKKNTPMPRRYVQGHWTHGKMHGYTSWGTGCSTVPVRYYCPPEVTLIRLKKG